MKPESLLGISLDLIQRLALPGRYPADARVGRFFRERRYLGSRDRRFVSQTAYAWLRHGIRARAFWRPWATSGSLDLPPDDTLRQLEADVARRGDGDRGDPGRNADDAQVDVPPEPRELVLRCAYLLDVLSLGWDGVLPWSMEETLAAAGRLAAPEDSLVANLRQRLAAEGFGLSPATPDDPVERLALECSLPSWIAARLIRRHGEPEARELGRSLLESASVDLRVNTRRRARDEVRKTLEREIRQRVEPTTFSPVGLRLEGRVNLTATTASRKSWIEVQDEGSQVVVWSTEPRAGMVVIDACAGNGGKTLAFADVLYGSGGEKVAGGRRSRSRLIACDIAPEKLSELERRAGDAGLAERIDIVLLEPSGPVSALPPADLVFVDAPCTGLGTLRRNPELKRRHREEDASRFAELQLSILERFAPLVKEGGRLAYATCSFLPEECEDVADAFERRHPELKRASSSWAAGTLPPRCVEGQRIRLDPLLTGTDAFFVCLWERGT